MMLCEVPLFMAQNPHHSDRDRLYTILAGLRDRLGCLTLADCNGWMKWPPRGVYFFFEQGEFRSGGITPRVVRVGTHAVSTGSKTKLWTRLSTHRGRSAGGGNHRGSIFRMWVGTALLQRDDALAPKPSTWGQGSTAGKETRDAEAHVEQAASACIRSMPFLFVAADDESGLSSIRRVIEKNAVALLSGCSPTGATADRPSEQWLGCFCKSEAVRRSGLWNVKDIDGDYDPGFLDVLGATAKETHQP